MSLIDLTPCGRSLSLKWRLLLSPLLMLLLVALLFWFGIAVAANYRDLARHLVQDDVAFVCELLEVSRDLTDTHQNLSMHLGSTEGVPGDIYQAGIRRLDSIRLLIGQLESKALQTELYGLPTEASRVDTVDMFEPMQRYIDQMSLALEMATLDTAVAQQHLLRANSSYFELLTLMSELASAVVDEAEQEFDVEMQRSDQWAYRILVGVPLFALLLVGMVYGQAQRLSKAFRLIGGALRRLAAGDIDIALPRPMSQPELCQMVEALREFKHAQQELAEIRAQLEHKVQQRTEALQREVEQHRSAKRQLSMAAQIIKTTSEGVLVTDKNNIIVEVNEAYCQITGYSREEAIGSTPSRMSSGRHSSEFYQQMWHELNSRGCWQGEIWDRRKSGEVYPRWLSINVMRDECDEVEYYIGVFSDISDLKRKEAELENLAHYDPLTRLPNRLLCQDRVEQAIQRAKRNDQAMALMFIDLDNFKNINDSLGHAVGDQLLVAVAGRLQSTVRESDTLGYIGESGCQSNLVARLGGDEFLVVLADLPSIDAIGDIAQRLLNALDAPVELAGRALIPSASIGVALYPSDGVSYGELVRNADAAMYRAKKTGRNRFMLFTEEMNLQAQRRLELELEMRSSISKGEFALYYQPKVCADNERWQGMEALLRWNHPRLGVVSPQDFISIAEETGAIIALGEFALEQACGDCAQFNREHGTALSVAVNISPRQFADTQFTGKVQRALKRAGLAAALLELEITESIVIGDLDDTLQTIRELRELGVKVALDDFGTGYSSLSYLRALPIDTLKIDRSFIAALDQADSGSERAIVEMIIRMGQSLNMSIVAEGVETAAHGALLRAMDCDILQGYYYSRPLPLNQLVHKWLQQCALLAGE